MISMTSSALPTSRPSTWSISVISVRHRANGAPARECRSQIISTKPPQAATIGASIMLTLSPTPGCLSMIGPATSRSFQSRVTPDRTRPMIKATRSLVLNARKNTSMAKAVTCPSFRLLSVMPRAMKAIFSCDSSCPPRFLRKISCGSM